MVPLLRRQAVYLASNRAPCDNAGMEQHDLPDHRWLAEINRRILAGRPVSAAELDKLEDLYAAFDELVDLAIARPPRAHRSPHPTGRFRTGAPGAV